MEFPCKHAERTWVWNGIRVVRCGNEVAVRKTNQGESPSAGVCMRACQYYDGPERTPELIEATIDKTITEQQANGSKITWDMVKSYMRAKRSLLRDGPVSDEVVGERWNRCVGKVQEPDGRFFCTRCGCGKSDDAELQVKMRMPKLECKTCGIEHAPGQGRKKLKESEELRNISGMVAGVLRESRRRLLESIGFKSHS